MPAVRGRRILIFALTAQGGSGLSRPDKPPATEKAVENHDQTIPVPSLTTEMSACNRTAIMAAVPVNFAISSPGLLDRPSPVRHGDPV